MQRKLAPTPVAAHPLQLRDAATNEGRPSDIRSLKLIKALMTILQTKVLSPSVSHYMGGICSTIVNALYLSYNGYNIY